MGNKMRMFGTNNFFLFFLGIILSSFLAIGFTFSQTSNIGDISVDFCNGDENTKSLGMVLDSGKDGEICMEFSNFSDNDVGISYGFVDGSVTADKYKSKACKNEGDIELFGQYVNQEVSHINIPSMSKIRQKVHVKFPAGLTGMVNGCLTYFVSNVSDTTSIDSAMFDVLVRKASFIDVLVGGKLSRSLKLSSKSNSIKTYYDKKNDLLVLEATFINGGTVNEGVILNGEVSNMFGYNASFSGKLVKVLSDGEQMLRMEINNIPWYRGPFDIKLNVVSNPQFDFDPGGIPDNMKDPIFINADTSIFLFPWVILYIVLGLIVLIVLVKTFSKHLKFQ